MNTSRNSVIVERRAIPAPAPILLHLPFPPSANGLFREIAGRGRVPTPAYAAWRTLAADVISRSKVRRLNGPVEIAMIFGDKAGRSRLDSLPKACLEILVAKSVIEADDSRIVRRLSLRWGEGPGATVEIHCVTDETGTARSGGGRAWKATRR